MNKTKALSYMLAVPEDPTDVVNGVLHLARLKNAKDFSVNGLEEKAGELQLTIGYLGKEYLVRMIPTEFKIPELYRIQHFFPDVDVDAYYGQAVLWAVEEGITGGFKDGTFGPNKTCKRDQIVTFLYRYMVA